MARASATQVSAGAVQLSGGDAPLLGRTAIPNVNALNAQELEALWLAIDSSADSSSSGDDVNDDGYRTVHRVAAGVTVMPPTTSRRYSSASTKSSSSSESGSPTAATTMNTENMRRTTMTKRKPRTFTPAQVDQRRRRNRDSMRRVRQRKQVEVDHLRQHMELLQAKLDELRIVHAQTGSSSEQTILPQTAPSGGGGAVPSRPQRSNSDVQELLESIKALQFEQLCLHDAILNHQQVTASLVQVVNESKSLLCQPHVPIYTASTDPQAAFSPLDADACDAFQWVDAVLPLLPPLSCGAASVVELVRESYLAIADHVRRADTTTLERANQVLGWSDRRVVNAGGWADFVFCKDFAHETIEPLVARTWRVLTHTDQRRGFQSQGLHLKVLERLNDDTLIMARSAYAPLERRHYSSIYVLLRVQTADGGCLIGGRTIKPLPEYAARFQQALGADRAYAHMCYGLQFNRLAVTARVAAPGAVQSNGVDSTGDCKSSSDEERSPSRFAERGCSVQYGGRLGNGSALMAKTWAMDVLLAALRWENACVQSLYRLSA